MANYSILVLGDSVTWGQGLPAGQKMHDIVSDRLAQTHGPVQCFLLAHSGAVIGVDSGTSQDHCDGEVPTAFPTILQQCDSAAATDADLVIVNGGINDIDIRYILNPFTEQDDLVDTTRRFCGKDMAVLLDRALARFTAAQIVVTSYYPILSQASHVGLFDDFMLTLGLPIEPLTRLIDDNLIYDRIVSNCELFYTESTSALQAAVDAANAQAAGRVALAVPPFTEDNAALASNAWLFGINADLSPEDPVAAARHASCDRCTDDFLRRQQCYRASAGHPNVTGAQQFGQAILAAIN
jgi:lysophospholipase L1-like esterase